jgi:hypothetical protein
MGPMEGGWNPQSRDRMNQNIIGVPEFSGVALTEQELAEMVGGDGTLARWIGYASGYAAGFAWRMIVLGATEPSLQGYCFGA